MQLRIFKLTTRCDYILDRRRLGIGVHAVNNCEVRTWAEIKATIGGDPGVLAIGGLQLGWRVGLSAENGC